MYIDLSVPHCARKQRECTDCFYFSELLNRGGIFFQKCLYCVRSGYTATRVDFLCINIKQEHLMRWENDPIYRLYPNQLNRPKRVEEFHGLKRQLLLSEVSQVKWREPFDFPSGIDVFFHANGKYPRWSWMELGERECRLNKDRRKTPDHT